MVSKNSEDSIGFGKHENDSMDCREIFSNGLQGSGIPHSDEYARLHAKIQSCLYARASSIHRVQTSYGSGP